VVQVPSNWQVTDETPFEKKKPVPQVYVAVELYVVGYELSNEPCVMLGGAPQSIRVQLGSVPVQYPSRPQVRVGVPDRRHPLVHEYVAVEPYVVPVSVNVPYKMRGGA
jgi:hypothetical protein